MMSEVFVAPSCRSSAGHSGTGVRSDCSVEFVPGAAGGLQIEINSRVINYYGESIRTLVSDIARRFGLTDARIIVNDEGALPFTIAARVEAALRLAGFSGGPFHSEKAASSTSSPRLRMRRSRLYLPGSEPKYFVNAALHAPDAIILDLEDSVHPDDKFASRILVRNALRSVDFRSCERMVRINQLPLGLEDLDEIVAERPDLILIPKVETAAQIQAVDSHIASLELRHDIAEKIWFMPIIESALGVENAFSIATASDRNVALTIGLEDYTADLGVAKSRSGEETLYARSRIVNAARAAGLQAIDSVFGDVGDLDALRTWSERSRALGFEGMGCVHPSQIEIVHRAFSPSTTDIEKALKIVNAFIEAKAAGRAVVSVGSKMIDPPVVARAQQVVARATALGLVPNDGGDAQ